MKINFHLSKSIRLSGAVINLVKIQFIVTVEVIYVIYFC